jgi:hypothetical protein
MKSTRKPFVAPRLKEEASLAGVTLISGGSPTRNCRKPSARTTRHNYNRRGHGT